MHGLDCLVELLGFEISLIKSGSEGVHNDLNVFGLDLLAATLSAGKSAFAQHEMMMSLIREDLFQAIFHLAKTSNLACLSGVTQVALGLYVHLGKQLLLQLEAYLNLVLMRVAEGKGPGGSDHQEAALEVMLQVTSPCTFFLLPALPAAVLDFERSPCSPSASFLARYCWLFNTLCFACCVLQFEL